jgi:hypothetical protein
MPPRGDEDGVALRRVAVVVDNQHPANGRSIAGWLWLGGWLSGAGRAGSVQGLAALFIVAVPGSC